jgi:SAM-dependent methyltransferase
MFAENYAGSFALQWNKHRKTQLDSFTGLTISRDRLFGITRWPADLTGQTILEAGSGAGRFTEVLVTTGAEIVSFDLSSAIEANFRNNGHNKNLRILRADILDIPVPPMSFDKVLGLGVIQHTPDPGKAFLSLAECVKPGGEIVIDVYAARLRALLSWKYILRPVTKRMSSPRLYALVEWATPRLFPVARALSRILGRAGPRLLPIVYYPGLPSELSLQWSILDTFDMLSPVHDHPQTLKTVRRWFEEAGFVDVFVGYGPNGIVGRGRRP